MAFVLAVVASSLAGRPREARGVDLGGYYFLGARSSKVFHEIKWVELWMTDEAGRAKTPEGAICLVTSSNAQKRNCLSMETFRLEGDRFEFKTEARSNVRYSFSGRFTRVGVFWNDAKKDEILLKGHLVKLGAEKAVREADGEFTFSGGE